MRRIGNDSLSLARGVMLWLSQSNLSFLYHHRECSNSRLYYRFSLLAGGKSCRNKRFILSGKYLKIMKQLLACDEKYNEQFNITRFHWKFTKTECKYGGFISCHANQKTIGVGRRHVTLTTAVYCTIPDGLLLFYIAPNSGLQAKLAH
jgi:hypothetical protein